MRLPLVRRTGLQQSLVLRFAKSIFYWPVLAEEVEADISEHKFVVSDVSRQIPFDTGEPLIICALLRSHDFSSTALRNRREIRQGFDYVTNFVLRLLTRKEGSLHIIRHYQT